MEAQAADKEDQRVDEEVAQGEGLSWRSLGSEESAMQQESFSSSCFAFS